MMDNEILCVSVPLKVVACCFLSVCCCNVSDRKHFKPSMMDILHKSCCMQFFYVILEHESIFKLILTIIPLNRNNSEIILNRFLKISVTSNFKNSSLLLSCWIAYVFIIKNNYGYHFICLA